MKVRLELGGAWAIAKPSKVELADNEALELEVMWDKDTNSPFLQYGEKTYYYVDRHFVIPSEDIENNKPMFLKCSGRTWYVRSFLITKHDLSKEIERKDIKLEVKVAQLENELAEQKAFNVLAKQDIENLCQAYNKLAGEFDAVKEEMAL